MSIRTTIALLCAPLLAAAAAGCGAATVSTSGFKGEQQKVAQTVAHLQSHATALEAKKICSDDLDAADVARLDTVAGGCKRAIESQLKQIDSFETTVQSVQVNGATATAHVKSVNGGKKTIQTITLVKEDGKWKVSSVS